jgi:hypothetical protein
MIITNQMIITNDYYKSKQAFASICNLSVYFIPTAKQQRGKARFVRWGWPGSNRVRSIAHLKAKKWF